MKTYNFEKMPKTREEIIANIKSNLGFIMKSKKNRFIDREFFVDNANSIIEKNDNLTIEQLNGLNLAVFAVSNMLM